MLEDRGAEVNGDAGVDESGEQVRAGADPAQAQATPMGLARRADGDGTGVVGGEGQGVLAVVETDLGDRLVDEGEGVLTGERTTHQGALGVGHVGAGRVVEVGHEHGGPRTGRGDGGGHGRGVPAGVVNGDGHEAGSGAPQRFCGVGVGRVLDQDPVPGGEEGPLEDGHAGHGTTGHEDLVGARRQSAGGEPCGNRLAHLRHAEGEVAGAGQVGRQLVDRCGVRLGHSARRAGGSTGEIEDVMARLGGIEGGAGAAADLAGGNGDRRAGALPRHGIPTVAEHGIGASDRRAAHTQRGREVALAREAGADDDAPVGDE